MTPDLRDFARQLLRREPTRSLPLGLLRERLREATGSGWAGAGQLERALAADPSFRVLRSPPLIQAPAVSYLQRHLTAGFPQPEPRVLLMDADGTGSDGEGFLGDLADSLLPLLGNDELRADVAEAIAALAEIGERLQDLSGVTRAAAARSTTPPPSPPPPGTARPRGRPPAAPRPRPPGSRSG